MLPITLHIKTPGKNILHTKIKRIKLPGADKPFEVRKNHLAIMTPLDKGEIHFITEGGAETLHIEGGFVAVRKNRVTIILESLPSTN